MTPDLHDLVRELTQTHTHREPYEITDNGTTYRRHHTTRVPALITQLEHAAPSSTGDTRAAAGYASRPAARLEALDALALIDAQAAAWVRVLGHDDPSTTLACVKRAHALHAALPPCDRPRPGCCQHHQLEHDIRRWWTSARIVTGYDTPAWRPDNTCPLCGERGTLRVRLATHAGTCASCGEWWGPDTIGLLADHIRAENLEDGVDDDTRYDQTA